MKPRTYFRLALVFPYLLWGICVLVTFLLSSLESRVLDWLLIPFMIYALGVFAWLVPYTVLAVGMWIWSKNKSTTALYKLALISPFLFAVLMLVEATLISLPVESMTELLTDMFQQAGIWVSLSLLFGYLCVAATLGIFQLLKIKGFVAEERPSLAPQG